MRLREVSVDLVEFLSCVLRQCGLGADFVGDIAADAFALHERFCHSHLQACRTI